MRSRGADDDRRRGLSGRQLATQLVGDGHAVRITTRTEDGRAAIEAAGAECWIGTPDRLATLRGALDSVTILCWLLGSATGSPSRSCAALHTTRLEFFLTQAIDTTVRGFVYEARGNEHARGSAGRGRARSCARLTERNSIPAAFLTADPEDQGAWLAEAAAAISELLTRV